MSPRFLICSPGPAPTLSQPRLSSARPHAKPAQAFISIILLVYWLDPKPPFCNETFDVIELYAGRARITRMARAAGFMCVASDQAYDPSERSALHLNENSGFALLGYKLYSAWVPL